MKKPNFFIIGAPKCGTTSMAAWLEQHPQIFFSPQKETRYFSHDLNVPQRVRDYDELFRDADRRHIAVGEGSTEYIYSDAAICEIQKYQPDAKYIVMLRNPADLVWSWHKQMLFNGWQTVDEFEGAWAAGFDFQKLKQKANRNFEPLLLQYQYIGAVGTRISRLLERIERERVHIVLMDDLRQDTAHEFSNVLLFLGVDVDSTLDLSARHTGIERRSKYLSSIIRTGRSIKHRIGFNGSLGLLNALNSANKSANREKQPPDMRRELTAYFQPEVELLEQTLNRDLSDWKELKSELS